MLKTVKKTFQKVLCLLCSAALCAPGMAVPVSADTAKTTWPVNINGQVVTVPYDGEAHTASGYSVGVLPDGASVTYNGPEISITETEVGEYTKDFDPDDFEVTGNDQYDYTIVTNPVALNILSKKPAKAPSSVTDEVQPIQADARLNLTLVDNLKEGTTLKEDAFTFHLYQYDADSKSYNTICTNVPVKADGTADFGTLTFPDAGTYKFEVGCVKVQDGCENPGFSSYSLVVRKITLDGKEVLALESGADSSILYTSQGTYQESGSTYTKLDDKSPVAAFKVTAYHGKYCPIPVRLQTKVTLDDNPNPIGLSMTAGMFTFELLDENGKVLGTAANEADGTVNVDIMIDSEFTEKTYYFRQVVGDNPNIGYDKAKLPITVYNIKSISYPGDPAKYLTYVDEVYESGQQIEYYYHNGGKFKKDGDSYTKVSDDLVTFKKSGFENWTKKDSINNAGTPLSVYLDATTALQDLTGKRKLAAGDFSFTLSLEGSDEVIQTVQNDADGKVVFPVTFTEPGTYTYQIKEVKGTDSSVTYAENVLSQTITVARLNQWESPILAVVTEGTYPDDYKARTPEFLYTINASSPHFEYSPADVRFDFGTFLNKCGVLKADLAITKHIADSNEGTKDSPVYYDDKLYDGMFKFNLYPVTYTKDADGTYYPFQYDYSHPIATATNDADGNVVFHGLTFDHLGSYRFLVKEQGFNPDNFGGHSVDSYGIDKDTMIYATRGSCIVYVTVSGTKNADGSYSDVEIKPFSESEFEAEVLKEHPDYTTSVFDSYKEQVPAAITKKADGTYFIQGQSINNAAAKVSLKLIVNATKVLKNGTLSGDDYTFNLIDQTKRVLATAKNDKDGNVHFEINFDNLNAPSGHRLYVQEVKGSDPGITYDENIYEVDAWVTQVPYQTVGSSAPQNIYPDAGLYDANWNRKSLGYYFALEKPTDTEGEYTYVTTKADAKNGNVPKAFHVRYVDSGYGYKNMFYVDGSERATTEADYTVGLKDNAVITNTKTAYSEAPLVVTAHKELTGRKLKASEFTFCMEITDYPSADQPTVVTATNAEDGTITFPEVKFDQPGTYHMKVYEDATKNKQEHVIYDPTVKEYTVSVAPDPNQSDTLAVTVQPAE